MSLVQAQYADESHKEFYKFCNTLRCPLCGGQLDGSILAKKATLYCVNNNDEYKCHWLPGEDEPDRETIKYWYPQYEYLIHSYRISSGIYKTTIDRFNLDVILKYRHTTRKEVFSHIGSRLLFFRTRMEEEIFLKKLKTYNVFS
jgi:hypothetical protein